MVWSVLLVAALPILHNSRKHIKGHMRHMRTCDAIMNLTSPFPTQPAGHSGRVPERGVVLSFKQPKWPCQTMVDSLPFYVQFDGDREVWSHWILVYPRTLRQTVLSAFHCLIAVTVEPGLLEAFHILLDGEPDKVLHPERQHRSWVICLPAGNSWHFQGKGLEKLYEYKGTNPDRFAFVLFFMPFEADWSGMPLQMFERAPSGWKWNYLRWYAVKRPQTSSYGFGSFWSYHVSVYDHVCVYACRGRGYKALVIGWVHA